MSISRREFLKVSSAVSSGFIIGLPSLNFAQEATLVGSAELNAYVQVEMTARSSFTPAPRRWDRASVHLYR